MEETDWKKYGEVVGSKYSQRILISLKGVPTTPSKLSTELKCSVVIISRSLAKLKKLKLVKCLNEEKKKGRLYTLTEEGKKFADLLSQLKVN